VSFHSTKPTIVASPALSHISVASWSALDNIYQQNVADATAAILEVLQSPHNTWNYPSPLNVATCIFQPIIPESPQPQYSPSPAPVWSTLDNVKDFPFLNVPDSPAYIITSAPISPAPVASLDVLAHVATHKPQYQEDKQENLLPAPTQDSFIEQIFGGDPQRHVATEDILAASLPSPVVEAQVATILSPAPEPQTPLADLFPLPEAPLANLFPNLFHAPTCTFAIDCHPYQYTIIYNRGVKFWVPQEEFIKQDFLRSLPHIIDLDNHPISFITPFRTDVFHNVWVKSNSPLPSINLCAKVGRHPHSASFPFSYLKSSFVDSIKFTFGQFPPDWLEHFEGALVPLVAYNFLDGHLATLCGQLHFTTDGVFVIERNTCTEDLLRTQPRLATFICTPCVPTNPFACIMPPPVEAPL